MRGIQWHPRVRDSVRKRAPYNPSCVEMYTVVLTLPKHEPAVDMTSPPAGCAVLPFHCTTLPLHAGSGTCTFSSWPLVVCGVISVVTPRLVNTDLGLLWRDGCYGDVGCYRDVGCYGGMVAMEMLVAMERWVKLGWSRRAGRRGERAPCPH
jgi:hypothetical protein